MKALALLLVLPLSGCGTVITLSEDKPRLLIYSGVRLDVEEAGKVDEPFEFYPWWMGCWDLPCSLVADTLVLPYTLLRELWRAAPEPER